MSNEVKTITADPDDTVTFDVVSPEEMSEGELQEVSGGIIAVIAPKAANATQVLTMRKSGGDQQEYL